MRHSTPYIVITIVITIVIPTTASTISTIVIHSNTVELYPSPSRPRRSRADVGRYLLHDDGEEVLLQELKKPAQTDPGDHQYMVLNGY